MNEKLHRALNEISNQHLSEAENYRRRNRRPYFVGAIAAVLAVALILTAILTQPLKLTPTPDVPTIQGGVNDAPTPQGIKDLHTLQLANLLAAPTYPEMVQRPEANNTNLEEYRAWQLSLHAQYNQPLGYADNLTNFFKNSIPLFLNAEKNSVYSPINVYMALAMLAETSDGASRQQVLDALDLDSIEALREQVKHVWNAHYQDDGVTTLLLSNSVWLDETYPFRNDATDALVNRYYASCFHGDLGSEAMNQQLRDWLNATTGGLLQEQTQNVTMDSDTVFSLVSSIYFAADWVNEFNPDHTQDMAFHCGEYDLLTPFMRTFFSGTYYRGANFGAVRLGLEGNNGMWLILPDKGYTVSDILASDEYLQMTLNPNSWENRSSRIIHLNLPKFDVVSETDLSDGLKSMGITNVFDREKANFSPITYNRGLQVNGISHAARVVIDEEGCLAAAYTTILMGNAGLPNQEIDFTVDRPFLFVISSRDNLPLFAGTVAQP